MMAPKARGPHDEGLLEYLEDIIGSNTYVEKIEEEAKRWVRAQTNGPVALPGGPAHVARGGGHSTSRLLCPS